jgi:hypothetical protein
MEENPTIKPFENCPALDGYHCQTNSLAKIFHHYGHPLSEDLILGLGAGMGFIYWKMKMKIGSYVFIGGRGNTKDFFNDLGNRTGVRITTLSTSSVRKAEKRLLQKLVNEEPIMLFGDMGFLPWFDLPEDYHFGGHTFVVCGFDGTNTALASDMDQKATGLKKGFYYPITLDQLRKARGSTYKPFPPKNKYLEFNFDSFHKPRAEDVLSSINQTVKSQLCPPIKNIGVKGLRHTSKEILKWPNMFEEIELRMNLFSLYIFIEIGGTGGGCFRYMYSRFLREAMEITGNKWLSRAAEIFHEAGQRFTQIGLMFKDAETMDNINEKIEIASQEFNELARIEEEAYSILKEKVVGAGSANSAN